MDRDQFIAVFEPQIRPQRQRADKADTIRFKRPKRSKRRSPLPSVREIDAELERKYGSPPFKPLEALLQGSGEDRP